MEALICRSGTLRIGKGDSYKHLPRKEKAMLEVIVAHANAVTAFATVVLVIITGYYAYENRQMRLDAQKPKIAIAPYCFVDQTRRTLICLHIENIGPGPAYDVQFETDANFRLDTWISLGDIYIFKNGINYLKPGGEKNCAITRNELERQKETPLKFDVTYKDRRNKEYSESFDIDFNETRGVLDTVPKN